MKSLILRGQHLKALKFFIAGSIILMAILFACVCLNISNANASEEDSLQNQMTSETINIDRAKIGNAGYTVRVHLFTDVEFTYKDEMEASPVTHTAKVFEAQFETADYISVDSNFQEPFSVNIFGRVYVDDKPIDHYYTIDLPQGHGYISFNYIAVDEYTVEFSIMYGKAYNVTLHTEKGYIYKKLKDFDVTVVEGRKLNGPIPTCDDSYFIGYTYNGLEGSYITNETIVPEEGVWQPQINAVWESYSNKNNFVIETNSASSNLVYKYQKREGPQVFDIVFGKIEKFDIYDFLEEEEEIQDFYIYYTISLFDFRVDCKKNGVIISHYFQMSVEDSDKKIIDYVVFNGKRIDDTFKLSTNDKQKVNLNFKFMMKDSEDINFRVTTNNRTLFNSCYDYDDDEGSAKTIYSTLSSLDITVPRGYEIRWNYGDSKWYEESNNDYFKAYSNENTEYTGMTLYIGCVKYGINKKNNSIYADRKIYAISDFNIPGTLNKKTQIKSVYYGDEQITPFTYYNSKLDQGKNFNLNVVDYNPTVYDAKFDANGGSFSDNNGDLATVSQKVTTKYNLPEAPTRDGYTFDGWFSSADGGEQYTTDTYVWDPADEDESNTDTFYAHWTQNEQPPIVDPPVVVGWSAQTGDINFGSVIALILIVMLSNAIALRYRKNW